MVAVVLGVAVFVVMLIAELAVVAVRRAEAQTAADVAALAGVVEGRAGAEDLARRNGMTLLAYDDTGSVVHVTVGDGLIQASASAELDRSAMWSDQVGLVPEPLAHSS